MKKKSRVKSDAFNWVDGVIDKDYKNVEETGLTRTKRATTSEALIKEPAITETKHKTASSQNQRLVVIAYKNENGDIMASQELTFDSEGNGNISWSGISKDTTVKVFKLIGELADKEIIEIHRNYKVSELGKLNLKSR